MTTLPDVSHVHKNVWVGSKTQVNAWLEMNWDGKQKIGIVSIGDFKDPKWSNFGNKKIKHTHYGDIKDTDTEKFREILGPAASRIQKYSDTCDYVFVHCWKGVNRSVSLTIGWLMLKQGMSYAKALATVEMKRKQANPWEHLTKVLKAIK